MPIGCGLRWDVAKHFSGISAQAIEVTIRGAEVKIMAFDSSRGCYLIDVADLPVSSYNEELVGN